MGYGGYLVKFGNYTIPNSLIKQDTFSSYVNMQDKDPWTDENGYEHRDAVELKALASAVAGLIGVMKNDFSIVHKFLSANTYSH